MSDTLRLYNTMSRSVERFKPRKSGEVKIFTCGPSTYRRPHIGNYRTFLYEDIVVRYLEYLGYHVRRVINFTDVEDKAIVEAENAGKDVEEITGAVQKHFFREAELLGLKLPPEIPRSSTSVDQAVEIIQKLVKDGHAYWDKGDVLFDPLTFDDFGKLFRLDMSKWPKKKVKFRKDTYNGNRWNLGDFILWHGHDNEKPGSAYWDTEIGRGRPAWNIQDPAMILQQLGTQVDINCGGIDNIYRHHDYNIAIMESHSGKTYANYYMHGEHLIVDGTPMSKSRGNILYPDNLVERGYDHKHLRFFLIHEHYRKKLNFTDETFECTIGRLERVRSLVEKLTERSASSGKKKSNGSKSSVDQLVDSIESQFVKHMNDDFSVGVAFNAVTDTLEEIAKSDGGDQLNRDQKNRITRQLQSIDTVLGVLFR